jgi:hypothetical protein
MAQPPLHIASPLPAVSLREPVSARRVHDAAPIRYVFIDAAMYYVDERGEHSGLLSEIADTEEMRSRLQTVSNNVVWLEAAVALGEQLINLARRAGEQDAWGATSGFFSAGARSGPNRIARVIRAATGIGPPSPAFGALTKPERGHWSVRRVFGYDVGPDAPCVAIWHLGFTENPQFWPRWCDAIARRATPPVLILPDSPITRELARAWSAGELLPRRQSWRGDNVPANNGRAPYMRVWVSQMIEADGTGVDGARLRSAIAFLEVHHQLKVSPLDLLADPLLSGQLAELQSHAQSTEWTQKETRALERARRDYEPSQGLRSWQDELRRSPPQGIFAEGSSFSDSVSQVAHTARQALKTGDIARCLISSWTGFAPSALDRGEHPQVPACTGSEGELIDWYRDAFVRAVAYGLIDEDWYRAREQWHAEAYLGFPAEPTAYYDHIYAAERGLHSPEQRKALEGGGGGTQFKEWYSSIFALAEHLGLCPSADAAEEVARS